VKLIAGLLGVGLVVASPACTSAHHTSQVSLPARADRTPSTLVPSTVSSIDVTRQAIDGPNRTPKTVRVTDHKQLVAVVNAFDSLNGDSMTPHGCGSPVGVVYDYAVTFHWPGHSLVVDPGQSLCGLGRGLTRDGKKLAQTLEDSETLDSALAAAFRG